MFGFFFVRQKNFEKDEMYRKAFKSSDDGTLSTQPGNIRIISQCDKWWEGGGEGTGLWFKKLQCQIGQDHSIVFFVKCINILAVWSQLTTHFNWYSPHLNTFHNINILS